MGRTGSIEPILFANLAGASESHIRINQLNGKSGENVRKKLAAQVHKVVNRQSVMTNGATLQKLLNQLLAYTAIDLSSKKSPNVEERRILWTTYTNLKSWLDNWSKDLVDLGFAKIENGKVMIPPEQLFNIVNIDETCLILDGSKSGKGGRPVVIFYDRFLPEVGKA